MSKKHERNCERKKINEKQKERDIKEWTRDNKKHKHKKGKRERETWKEKNS